MPPEAKNLAALDFEDLKAVMYNRLRGVQTLGPPLDHRGDISPYSWLVDQYEQGGDGLRDRMSSAASSFLLEIADLDVWPVRAREQLMNLVARARLAPDTLRRMIHNETALRIPHLGQTVHATLLRCAIMAGMKFTPAFWQGQNAKVEDGNVIFNGLLLHGLDVAMKHLHECCTDEDTAFYIAQQIPGLVDEYSAKIIGHAFHSCLPKLSRPLRREFEEMLELSGVPPQPQATRQSASAKPADAVDTAPKDTLEPWLFSLGLTPRPRRRRKLNRPFSKRPRAQLRTRSAVHEPNRTSGALTTMAGV